MKLEFTIFKHQIKVESLYLYEVSVYPCDTDDPTIIDAGSVFLGRSLCAAYYEGWRMARFYSREFGESHTFVVSRAICCDRDDLPEDWETIYVKTLVVKKSVQFFSK